MIETPELQKVLPQSYPFMMIDRIVEFKEGESLTAIKNITSNEWLFEEDTPTERFFPETLLIEAAAQAALVLYQLSKIPKGEKRPSYVLGKVVAEFDGTVAIGDQLTIHALANKMMDTGGYSDISLTVNSKKVADIEIIYSVKRESKT